MYKPMISAKEKAGRVPDKNKKSENRGHGKMPSENSGKRTSKKEILYPHESESSQQQEGLDSSFTERNDVTPPRKKGFPSVGPAKTDFESRKLGRTTGRMIGHEPGTESI
jgi:hypothetical protein